MMRAILIAFVLGTSAMQSGLASVAPGAGHDPSPGESVMARIMGLFVLATALILLVLFIAALANRSNRDGR